MYVRAAIFLTLIFSAGAAFAGWPFEPQNEDRLTLSALRGNPELIEAALLKAEALERVKPDMPVPAVETLIREGNKRMREGDIIGARRSYHDALGYGDVAAALVLARSYDPIYFAKIPSPNAAPEPAKAFEWYQRAMVAGAVQTARVRMDELKRFMSK
jgi:hypothetical protein